MVNKECNKRGLKRNLEFIYDARAIQVIYCSFDRTQKSNFCAKYVAQNVFLLYSWQDSIKISFKKVVVRPYFYLIYIRGELASHEKVNKS